MAYTTIDDPTLYFNTVLYTGNGTTGHAITGVGFQPDWLWIKERSSTSAAFIYDVIRGVNVKITPSTTDPDSTVADSMTSFDSDGFTVGNNGATNESGQTVVAWNWLAGGTASSNTDGSITSSVSANTTSGFSIVSYTGTGANATVGHGLNQALDMVIVKNRNDADDWIVWHNALAGSEFIRLNLTNAKQTGTTSWNSTVPTSSVFSLGSRNGTNGSGDSMIAYCFAEKKGYSKFGSYTGNGNADGTFIYTGFKPSLIITKRTDSTSNWRIGDNKRDGFNDNNHTLFPDLSNAEDTSNRWDMYSNGFKLRTTNTSVNASGGTYIYMAFAENPFVSSTGIPTTAR